MIVVADASVLVGELLRECGRTLLADPLLHILVAGDQWNETNYEVSLRIDIIKRKGRLTDDQVNALWRDIHQLFLDRAIEIVPRNVYQHLESTAKRRIPRDPTDWPVVALALTLKAGILVHDQDFLGCGCPTWTIETLIQELVHLRDIERE